MTGLAAEQDECRFGRVHARQIQEVVFLSKRPIDISGAAHRRGRERYEHGIRAESLRERCPPGVKFGRRDSGGLSAKACHDHHQGGDEKRHPRSVFHVLRFSTSTVPASPSTTTQSPVSITSSGSRSRSVTLGTRMTTAPSAIFVVISLKTSAFGAVPARRAV